MIWNHSTVIANIFLIYTIYVSYYLLKQNCMTYESLNISEDLLRLNSGQITGKNKILTT